MTTPAGTAARKLTSTRVPSAYHRLHTLLHTMRCIGERENALCEMLHELESSIGVSDQQAMELSSILEHLPSHDYLDDLRSLTDLLDQPRRKRDADPNKTAGALANQKRLVPKSGTSSRSRPVPKNQSGV